MEKETGILGKLTSEGPACVPGFQGCCRDSGHGIRPRECPPTDQLLLTALAPNPQHHPTPKDTAQGGAQRPGSQLLHLNRYSPVWLLLSLLFPLVSFPMTAFFNEPLPGNPGDYQDYHRMLQPSSGHIQGRIFLFCSCCKEAVESLGYIPSGPWVWKAFPMQRKHQ